MNLVVGELTVKYVCRASVCDNSSGFGFEKPQVDSFSAFINHGAPSVAVFSFINPFVFGAVISIMFMVIQILSVRSLAQIMPSVVRWIHINVVNLLLRPISSLKQERQSVCEIHLPSYTHNDVSVIACAARYCSFFSSWDFVDFPCNVARGWVVGQQSLHLLVGEHLILRRVAHG